MAKEFDISDLNDLLKDLDKKGVDIKKAIKKGVTRTTKKCEGSAKRNAPVDSGILRNSISSTITEKSDEVIGEVAPHTEYEVYPEFGTGQRGMASQIERPEGIHYSANWKGQEAQPYMYPAYLEQRDKLAPNIKKELSKILKGAN